MNLFELVALVLIVGCGVLLGNVLAGEIGLWGWIVGVPAGSGIAAGAFVLLSKWIHSDREL